MNTIPEYLGPYIVKQDASLYTPIDHASWRFILRISKRFFSGHAHGKYLSGLKETGISEDRIPLISEMDECLRKFGWQAVAVSGFIPPAVFMEFLSLGVLPIACDMRKLENLSYTPAPDIVHEAAGHAPIIANPEYAAYLRSYGEISQKAIFTKQDLEVYYAIRNLSDTKENPASTTTQIAAAQKQLDAAVAAVDHVSEATQLARMSWWTIEYGLVGDFKNPKIYGAGLLSSIAESYHCLSPQVKKIPFSIDCVEMTYDITKPQPQLYVAKDFRVLTQVLEQLAEKMSFRLGGMTGLERAKKAQVVTTTVLDTGVQISGVVADYKKYFVKYSGPCQISFQNCELDGQGAKYHSQGFSAPIGKVLKDSSNRIEFESGVVLEGNPVKTIERDGKILVRVFSNCTIRQGEEILYRPEWGNFDLACGEKVVSVFAGAADRKNYLGDTGGFKQEPGKPKTNLTPSNRKLNELYREVREIRESGNNRSKLESIEKTLAAEFQNDWLLPLEILELDPSVGKTIRDRLARISKISRDHSEMIARGLEIL